MTGRGVWPIAALGEVCSPPQYGWTTKARAGSDGLKLLRTTDISAGAVDWDSVPVCVDEPAEPEKYLLRDGDVVISRAGSIGLSYLVTGSPRAVFASYLIRFRPGEGISPRYLAWFLQSPAYWSQVRAKASGIALQNVNAKQLWSIRLPVPSVHEQESTVAAIEQQVSRVDASLALVTKSRARLRDLRDAILERHLISGHDERELIALCAAFADCEHRTPAYGSGDIPALRPRDVVRGAFDLEGAGRVSFTEYARQTRRHVPEPEDIVYSRELSYGWAAKIPEGAKVCLGQGMVVFRLQPDVLPMWVVLYLNSRRGRGQAIRAATGSAHPHINLREIKRYLVPVPSVSAQSSILAVLERELSIVDGLDGELAVALQRAKRLKQTILTEAFRGGLTRRRAAPQTLQFGPTASS